MKTTLLARKEYNSLLLGWRSIEFLLRENGDYAVRLYLPAGEVVAHEHVYAYIGPDHGRARTAWCKVTGGWDLMYDAEKEFITQD